MRLIWGLFGPYLPLHPSPTAPLTLLAAFCEKRPAHALAGGGKPRLNWGYICRVGEHVTDKRGPKTWLGPGSSLRSHLAPKSQKS